MTRRHLLGGAPAFVRALAGAPGDRPNIIWIIAEDIGTEPSCCGRADVAAPNLDRLAGQGVLYGNCHTIRRVR